MWACVATIHLLYNTFIVGYPVMLKLVQTFLFSSAAQSTAARSTAGFHSEEQTSNKGRESHSKYLVYCLVTLDGVLRLSSCHVCQYALQYILKKSVKKGKILHTEYPYFLFTFVKESNSYDGPMRVISQVINRFTVADKALDSMPRHQLPLLTVCERLKYPMTVSGLLPSSQTLPLTIILIIFILMAL